MHTDRQNAKRVDRALRRAMTIPSGLGNGRSQSLEQILPRAIQHRDGGELRPALDFLEITPAHIGFFGQRYLPISRSRSSNSFQVPSESAGGDLQRNCRVKGHQAAAVFHCHRQQIGIGHLLVTKQPAAIEQRSIR
jgi:hypothetical protein